MDLCALAALSVTAIGLGQSIAGWAALERFRAGQMILALPNQRSRDRAQAVMLAELWIEKPFAKLLGVEHDSRLALPGDPDVRKYGTSAISFFRQDNL